MALSPVSLIVYFTPLFLVAYYLVPYFTTYSALRKVPSASPWAAFSSIWLAFQARKVRRSLAVHDAHTRLGKVVRIQPNHVSIADTKAVNQIYGHGNGFLKNDYYDAFVSLQRGLFSTRDRAQHSRKRKTVSHTFSAKSVAQFEQYLHHNLESFVQQWDRRSENAQGAFAKVDALSWCNYLAFDMIGDLAFGQPFGMLEKGQDVAEVRLTPDAPVTYARAVYLLDVRGELLNMLGIVPGLIPYAKWIPDPFIQRGFSGREGVIGVGMVRVDARVEAGKNNERADLLARLIEGKDDSGNPMGREELIAEALTQLVAGSDTTSNTLCAIVYWVLKTPWVFKKLRAELDAAIPERDCIPVFDQVKDLKYLRSVINETLRIHSPSSMGLPRIVPDGPGVEICGHYFPAGCVLSVPTYTMHHSKDIWGEDADEFRPERWDDLTEEQKAAFNPFSYGPRSCIGRNVAEMELSLATSVVCFRYDFELYQDEWELREGFLNKPTACQLGFRRRG